MQALFTKHGPEEGQVFLAVHVWLQLRWQSSQQLIQTYKMKTKHRASSQRDPIQLAGGVWPRRQEPPVFSWTRTWKPPHATLLRSAKEAFSICKFQRTVHSRVFFFFNLSQLSTCCGRPSLHNPRQTKWCTGFQNKRSVDIPSP